MRSSAQMLARALNQGAGTSLGKEGRRFVDYWWVFPPESSDDVIVTGGIAMPAAASPQARVIQYNVPAGLAFLMTHVVACAMVAGALNSAFAPGDGSLVFVLDVNQPLSSPVPIGSAVKGFSALTVPLGSFCLFPWPLACPRRFKPRDQIRWKVTNLSNTESNVLVACGIFGYTVPWDEVLI